MISRLAKCALLRGSSKKEKGTKNNSLISHQEKKESDLLLIDGKEIVYWKLDHELPIFTKRQGIQLNTNAIAGYRIM